MEKEETLTQVRVLLGQQKTPQANSLLFVLVDGMVKDRHVEEAIDLLQEGYDVFKDAGAMEYAISLLERAVPLAASLKQPTLQGVLLNNLALAYEHTGKLDEASALLTKAVSVMHPSFGVMLLGEIWTNRGFVERERSNLQVALQYVLKAREILEGAESKEEIARTYLELGIIYKDLGHHTEARINLEHALKLFTEQGDARSRGSTLIALGLMFLMQHEIEKVRSYYKEALQEYRSVNDRVNEALTLHNLGQTYDFYATSEDDYEIALSYYQQSLELNQQIEATSGIVADFGAIASLYQGRGDYEQARLMHELTLHHLEAVGDQYRQVETLIDLAILARDREERKTALEYMHKALRLARKINNQRLTYDVYLNRGDIYFRFGQARRAARDYEDAIRSIEFIRAGLLFEQEALAYLDEAHLDAYARLVYIYACEIKQFRQAQVYVERVKAREFLRRLQLNDVLQARHTPKALLQQEASLLTQRRSSADMLANDDTQKRLHALKTYQETEQRLQILWHSISNFDPVYANIRKGEPLSWKELQSCLQ